MIPTFGGPQNNIKVQTILHTGLVFLFFIDYRRYYGLRYVHDKFNLICHG